MVCKKFAKRLAQSKLTESEFVSLAELMNLITFKRDSEAFLESERTIILVTHEASRTGAPLLLLQLAKELASRQWECVVIVDRDGVTADEFSEFAHVINFRGAPNKYEDCSAMLDVLFARLKFEKPHLAILNSLETGRFAKPLAASGIRIISFVHELVDTYPRSFLKAVFQKSELVVFPARFVRDFALEKSNMPGLNEIVIPSALIDEDFGAYDQIEARRQIREEICATRDSLIVLACGTPDMRKGLDIFLHMTAVF